MNQRILLYIVIFLGILIVFSFFALIYGMYLKISTDSKDVTLEPENISLNLNDKEEIIDIEVIDENRLLITINNSDNLKGVIYHIKENKILEIIEK